jgi:hypothetical protein
LICVSLSGRFLVFPTSYDVGAPVAQALLPVSAFGASHPTRLFRSFLLKTKEFT